MHRGRSWRLGIVLGVGLVALVAAEGRAQVERYELGRRLREFERDWERSPDAEGRKRASRSLNEAVQRFFGMRLGDAGRSMTEARWALGSAEPVSKARAWAESLMFVPERRLIELGRGPLMLEARPFYKSGEQPPAAELRVTVVDAKGAEVEVGRAALNDLPAKVPIETKGLPSGDLVLVARVDSEGQTLATVRQTLSVVDRLGERRDRLSRVIAAWPTERDKATTERESARTLMSMLDNLDRGGSLETDIEANALLAELEGLVEADDRGQRFFGKERAGRARITLATEAGRIVPARISVPKAAATAREPLPLVVAMHGAGGTENLFFEGYGDGVVVRLGEERGWFVVAPRSVGFGGAPVSEVVDALAKIYPIDRNRVFLIGHSMGAMQAVGNVSKEPGRFAAVAALGGGGRVGDDPLLKELPIFVGVGTDDFALRGAQGLRVALQKLGARRLEYREYPDVEHLAIVQVAARDVYRFLDEAAASIRPQP